MMRGKTILMIAAGFVLGFAIGFLWQYTRAERLQYELAETERALTFHELGMTLGGAAVEAHAGSYEAARLLASDFFTGLQGSIGEAPADVADEMRAILMERDSVITALSRGQATSMDQLAALFVRYRMAWAGLEPAHEDPHPAAPAPAQHTE